jgi:hypothetical protein
MHFDDLVSIGTGGRCHASADRLGALSEDELGLALDVRLRKNGTSSRATATRRLMAY